MSPFRPNILIMISGSVAAYKSLNLISQLRQWGACVKVAMSESALQFVTPLSIESLSGQPALASLWTTGEAMAHIELMKWADLAILYPASSNKLQELAAGSASDLIGCLSLARDFAKPFWVAPAMNPKMWLHPATQKSIQQLRSWGYEILEPSQGRMACGDEGVGRLVEPDAVFSKVEAWSSQLKTKNQTSDSSAEDIHWLITAGGTREPVDAVRFIGNRSTGRTGAEIAQNLLDLGDRVTLITTPPSEIPNPHPRLKTVFFESFLDLHNQLKTTLELNRFDGVICAAAVSDYSPVEIHPTKKASSELDSWTLHLKKNPKLIGLIRGWAKNENLFLVGFKLLVHADLKEAELALEKQDKQASPDLIVFNDLSQVSKDSHLGRFWARGQWMGEFSTNREIAHFIRRRFLFDHGCSQTKELNYDSLS